MIVFSIYFNQVGIEVVAHFFKYDFYMLIAFALNIFLRYFETKTK